MQDDDVEDGAPAAPTPRGISTPRLDLKIELARRRAEAERRAASPFVPAPEHFEKGDHKAPAGAKPKPCGVVVGGEVVPAIAVEVAAGAG